VNLKTYLSKFERTDFGEKVSENYDFVENKFAWVHPNQNIVMLNFKLQ